MRRFYSRKRRRNRSVKLRITTWLLFEDYIVPFHMFGPLFRTYKSLILDVTKSGPYFLYQQSNNYIKNIAGYKIDS